MPASEFWSFQQFAKQLFHGQERQPGTTRRQSPFWFPWATCPRCPGPVAISATSPTPHRLPDLTLSPSLHPACYSHSTQAVVLRPGTGWQDGTQDSPSSPPSSCRPPPCPPFGSMQPHLQPQAGPAGFPQVSTETWTFQGFRAAWERPWQPRFQLAAGFISRTSELPPYFFWLRFQATAETWQLLGHPCFIPTPPLLGKK